MQYGAPHGKLDNPGARVLGALRCSGRAVVGDSRCHEAVERAMKNGYIVKFSSTRRDQRGIQRGLDVDG